MRKTSERGLLKQARAGNAEAFSALVEPYRRELQAHCYRLIGVLQDAEEAVQDTLLAAWRGLAHFEERASLRTWLYRIATRRSLNAMRSARRRPAKDWDIPGVEPLEPTSVGEVTWIEPFPQARHERLEALGLAFVTALQRLPMRQVSVLVLRDVCGFSAKEVASLCGSTVESVNSTLKRARASVQVPTRVARRVDEAVVAEFVRAWEAADAQALAAILTADVRVTMPPMNLEYEGREVVTTFFTRLFAGGRRFTLVRTLANGQPAFGAYLLGSRRGVGLYVLELRGHRLSALTRFEATVLPRFGLPESLPSARR